MTDTSTGTSLDYNPYTFIGKGIPATGLGTYQPFTGNLQYVGVDKLKISIPTAPGYSDGSADDSSSRRDINTTNGFHGRIDKTVIRLNERTTIHVEIQHFGNITYLDFNPSRILDYLRDRNTSELCPPDQLSGVVMWVIEYLKDMFVPKWLVDEKTGEVFEVYPSDWKDHVSIIKIALARDFYCDHPAFSLHALASIKKPYYSNDRIYRNNFEHNTLEWGKRPAIHKFYNKHKAPGHEVPEGWWRFESEYQRGYFKNRALGFLGNKTFRTLSDARPEVLLNLIKVRWEKSHLDDPFALKTDLAEIVENVIRQYRGVKAERLLGHLVASSFGIETGISARSKAESRRDLRKIGVSTGTPLDALGSQNFYVDLYKGELRRISDAPMDFSMTGEDLDQIIESLILTSEEGYLELITAKGFKTIVLESPKVSQHFRKTSNHNDEILI
jgi:hypothetical protein